MPSNLSNCIISCKNKNPKFGTKNVSFGYLLGLAWFQIWQGYCHTWNHAQILLKTNFVQKCRSLNLPKIPYLRILGGIFEKPLSYLKSGSSNLPYSQSLVQNKKSSNLGPKVPYLGIFELEFDNILSYLKSTSSNLSNWKILWKNKNA